MEKFGDCVTLPPVCVRAESDFHICYKQENGSSDSVITCVDTHKETGAQRQFTSINAR